MSDARPTGRRMRVDAPKSIAQGFASINRTPEQISETAELILHHPKLEYDHGDGISMDYDDAFDLAEAFLMVLRIARGLSAALTDSTPTKDET